MGGEQGWRGGGKEARAQAWWWGALSSGGVTQAGQGGSEAGVACSIFLYSEHRNLPVGHEPPMKGFKAGE